MAKPKTTPIRRIVNATGYSLEGLKAAWIYEAAVRQELFLLLFLTPLAFFVGEGVVEILLLLVVSWAILLVELINSAIESVVDRISDEYHELSKRAKDIGSAAVFVILVLNLICWSGVIGKNLFGWWS